MLNQPTLEKLRALKLRGMAEAFSEQLQKPMPDLDFESRLGLLIDREWYLKENRRLDRRLAQARLKENASIAPCVRKVVASNLNHWGQEDDNYETIIR